MMRLCLILVVFLITSAHCLTVRVSQENGADTDRCLEGEESVSCKSLSFVANHTVGENCSNLTVVILSNLQLDQVVSFTNCSSLKIENDTPDKRALTASDSHTSCGLMFNVVTNLTLSGITLSRCVFNLTNINTSGCVHIHQSTHINITDIKVTNVTGTGLILSDIKGSSIIQKSNFSFNNMSKPVTNPSNSSFAGGVHIQFSRNTAEKPTSLLIKECHFAYNKQPLQLLLPPANFINSYIDLGMLYGRGNGGGMSLIFMDDAQEVNVTVDHCVFSGNTGHAGGGMYVHFQNESTRNKVTLKNIRFEKNKAKTGGGLSIGMGKLRVINSTRRFNRMLVNNTVFSSNVANCGGGSALFAIHSIIYARHVEKMVAFLNCTWTRNFAQYSAALDVSPFQYDPFNQGFLPIPKFKDCNFTKNEMLEGRRGDTVYKSTGTFVITSFDVIFEGRNDFIGNKYTALRLTSATVILRRGTVMNFTNNEGLKGGAIAMCGFSTLKGSKDCTLVFHNNSASKVGGGIFYQPFEQREFISKTRCFIQYIDHVANNQTPNLTFIFSNNSATLGGTSIYSSSFYPCFTTHFGNNHSHQLREFFDRIGHFKFQDDTSTTGPDLATDGDHFVHLPDQRDMYETAPGKRIYIHLLMQDEFNNTVHMPLGLEISSSAHQKTQYYAFTSNKTKLYGHENDVLSMVFNTENIRSGYYKYPNVTLLDCPPGYYFDHTALSCKCSADSKATSYQGISKCNLSEFRAYIRLDYWAGYHKGSLYTAPCTFSVCASAINYSSAYQHLLPQTRSADILNEIMCGEYKSGLLCGECGKSYSAYFHSNSHKCGPEDKCNYNVIFYILSELLPVMILFTLIVHFNTPLTAGGITGLVFFSQMVVILPADVERIFPPEKNSTTVTKFKYLQSGYVLIYNLFNFDFFSIDELSFCLWKGAKQMDVLIVKYITTLFTLALIYVLICIMNSRWYMKKTRTKKPRSVVHGLSAFLIFAFAQCASVTFKILAYKTLKSTPDIASIKVTQHGGLPYFKDKHPVYAIPALFFLVFLVLLPPVLLLAYPLLLQLLALCRLSEHPLILRLLNVVRLNRLVPLFDSFQSCYKDKLRFFAGLYFVYKILLLMCQSLTNSLSAFYTYSEAIILVMLTLNSIAQPYRKRVHNIIDSCLFFNLGFIIRLSAYNYYLVTSPDAPVYQWKHLSAFVFSVQMLLTYAPIISSLIWCGSLLVRKRRHKGYQNLDSFHNMGEGERECVHEISVDEAKLDVSSQFP